MVDGDFRNKTRVTNFAATTRSLNHQLRREPKRLPFSTPASENLTFSNNSHIFTAIAAVNPYY